MRLVARRQIVAYHTPFVIVWEYLDQASLLWGDILRYLAPEICQDLPVLLVATATAASPLATLPAEHRSAVLEVAQILKERQEAEVLWLERVTEQDIAQYLGVTDPVLPQRLHHLADGIPALVESLWQQWQEAIPPAVVCRDDRWEVARTDNVWVFGEARDQVEAMVTECLAAPAPFDRFQVEQMMICAALEGLTFTAQAVAQVLGLPADDLMDFWDTFLLTSDARLGLLADAGFLDLPAVQGTTTSLNRYRFALPYLWHVWRRYCPEAQRVDLQRRVAEALEAVYTYARDRVSPILVALFEATGQESRAAPYRHRTHMMASLEALRWQVTILEALEAGGQDDAQDRYRLFALRVALSDGLCSEGRWEEGYLHAERAYTMAQRWHDARPEAQALNAMGLTLYQGAHFSRAEDAFVQALAIYERVFGPDHPHTASSLNNLALVYDAQGRYADAEPLHQRALAIRERVLGPDHPHTASSLSNLAGVYNDQGRYADAEPLHQRALAIYERMLGPDHPHTALGLNSLAYVYNAQGRYADAEPLFQRALAIRERVLGPDHPDTASSLSSLAGVYNAQGRYADAEPLHQRALAIYERMLGPDHPHTASSLNNLALVYDAQGRYADAEPLHQRALAIYERMLGPDHPHTALGLNSLAYVYNAQGRYADAEPLFQRALAIRERVLGPDHPDTASSLSSLAGVYNAQGRYADAEPLFQRALAIYEQRFGLNHPYAAVILAHYVSLLRNMHRDTEAADLENRAAAIRTDHV